MAASSSSSSATQRAARYLGLWWWLIRLQLAHKPVLFVVALLLGLCCRLGTLIGFLISIRCAAWILNPDRIPSQLKTIFPQELSLLFALLIGFSAAAFLGLALAQILYNSLGLKLRIFITEKLANGYAQTLLERRSEEELQKRQQLARIAEDVRKAYGTIYTVLTQLTTLLVTVLGLILALTVGMLLDAGVMSIIAAIGIGFAAATAIFRHFKSHDLKQQEEHALACEKDQQQRILGLAQKAGPDEALVPQLRKELPRYLEAMSGKKSVPLRFTFQSTLIVDIGQAVIIAAFLALLIGNSGSDAEKISKLIVLALLFRFMSSYLQTITHTIIRLGGHYPFLVDLRKTLRGTSASSGAV